MANQIKFVPKVILKSEIKKRRKSEVLLSKKTRYKWEICPLARTN